MQNNTRQHIKMRHWLFQSNAVTLEQPLCHLLAGLSSLLCSTTGTVLHHLLPSSLCSVQNQQLAALLTLWLVNPCWSLFLPCMSLNFLCLSARSEECLPGFWPGPPFMCAANGHIGICEVQYVNDLMRSKVCPSMCWKRCWYQQNTECCWLTHTDLWVTADSDKSDQKHL